MSPWNDPHFRLIGRLSDRLRTPLTAILGHADLLAEEADVAQQDRAQSIRRNGELLRGAIEDVLSLVNIAGDTLRTQSRTARIQETFERALAPVRREARARELMLALTFDEDLPAEARFDADHAAQVVRHLAENAVRFSKRGSVVIRVGFELPGTLSVEVADTGPGLTSEEFGQHAQGANGTGAEPAGLGLVIVGAVLRALGGSISCHGEPGRGTRLSLRLPAEPVERSCTARTEAPQRGIAGRVLVVDDAVDNRRLLSRVLERVGVEVATATNGREAVESAVAGSFDLILMDLQMPVLDGLAATRELRARGFRRPIIAVTANTAPNVEELCLEAGCDTRLTKPIDRLALLDVVEAALSVSRRVPTGPD